jgi:hypothetical protein
MYFGEKGMILLQVLLQEDFRNFRQIVKIARKTWRGIKRIFVIKCRKLNIKI